MILMPNSLFEQANFVAGAWRHEGGGEHLAVCDKYSGKQLAQIPLATQSLAQEAVDEAAAACASFKTWSAGKRAQHLGLFLRELENSGQTLAELICAEAGKPIDFARAEVARSLENLENARVLASRYTGELVGVDFGHSQGKTAYTLRVPVGVVLAMTPFNFPLNLALHKIGPALAVGCPVIVKPSPHAPLTALALAGLAHRAGYPKGFVQALCCDNALAQKLAADPAIAMLSFTGSAAVGWHLKNGCGKKKVTLELGGNAAAVVDETADLEKAARRLALGAHIYAGQICISTQRVYAVGAVFDKLVEKILEYTKELVVGDPAKEGVQVGPLIDAASCQRVAAWVNEAIAGGAKALCGARVIDEEKNLYAPTWLTNTRKDDKVACNEVFGPVAIVERAADFKSALAAANDSVYGLQAGVFTNSLERMKLAHQTLDVGAVIINNAPGFRVDSMPYGGVKDSGFGREGALYAMEEMTHPRLMVF
ncbi:MAG: aldehyde dehydrogenase family protein [Desulfatibacillaceae bacterium]|nr:aldehyde dehydrogenase family protein [Desulfatibacillaceae bacterium]